jgi:hypothetical protein
MTDKFQVTEIPLELIKVRDLFKERNSKTDVVVDGDKNVLRLIKKEDNSPLLYFYNIDKLKLFGIIKDRKITPKQPEALL